jgi:hypothetical protein
MHDASTRDRPRRGRRRRLAAATRHGPGWALRLHGLPWLALTASLTACQGIGPATLGAGRGAYNDVIARTNAEQMLALIVRLRYADPIGLITVANVTANLRFGAQAGGEAGIGAESGYAGNLVPFSAGVTYEDSPTISYVPVDAQAFLRAWLRPLPLGIVVPSMQAAPDPRASLPIVVESLNGVRSGAAATPEERAAFARVASLLRELRELGIASWVDASERAGKPRFEMVLADYAQGHAAEVAELLGLLGLAGDTRHGAPIRIPIESGVWLGRRTELVVRARSVSEILGDAAALVEVPEEHVREGVVGASAPPPGQGAPALRIRSSRKAPKHANVAVQHRGFWYYVDDTDLDAKRAFQAVQILFVSQLTEAARGAQTAPVLTIPVK